MQIIALCNYLSRRIVLVPWRISSPDGSIIPDRTSRANRSLGGIFASFLSASRRRSASFRGSLGIGGPTPRADNHPWPACLREQHFPTPFALVRAARRSVADRHKQPLQPWTTLSPPLRLSRTRKTLRNRQRRSRFRSLRNPLNRMMRNRTVGPPSAGCQFRQPPAIPVSASPADAANHPVHSSCTLD